MARRQRGWRPEVLAWPVEHQSARLIRAGNLVMIASMAGGADGELRSIADLGQDQHRQASAADVCFKPHVGTLI
ncbi:hypothetical protein [Streptomyces sp. NPDC049744]|uniref:hypothetical protein n=1 Tax=Streptomyces sp. NPDC049744 TaxID=3154359 RepID=UPI00344424B3